MIPPELKLADFSRCRVLLFRGRGLLSAFIRWQSRSKFAHAALLLPDGRILESWPGAGVRVTSLPDWDGVTVCRVQGMTEVGWRMSVSFACEQVGCGYDWLGVTRFVSRREMPTNTRWFCSELVTAAVAAGGVELVRGIPPSEVSPHLLSVSPLLILDAVHEEGGQ